MEKEYIPGVPIPKINPFTGEPFQSYEEKKEYTLLKIEEWRAKKREEAEKPKVTSKHSSEDIFFAELAIKFANLLQANDFTAEQAEALVTQMFDRRVIRTMEGLRKLEEIEVEKEKEG